MIKRFLRGKQKLFNRIDIQSILGYLEYGKIVYMSSGIIIGMCFQQSMCFHFSRNKF